LGTDCGIDRRYHFTCVVISEPQAEEISKLLFSLCFVVPYLVEDVFICPICTQTTRRRSASELNLKLFLFLSIMYFTLILVLVMLHFLYVVWNRHFGGILIMITCRLGVVLWIRASREFVEGAMFNSLRLHDA
jgi:hypothetical protein